MNNTINKKIQTRKDIKILDWNIQSSNTVSGSKFTDTDFCDILNQHDILCLQEIRQNVKYPGYRAYNKTHIGEKNGGVCILVKNELTSGVVNIKTTTPDIVICKLKRSFFNAEKDLFIICAYIKPANTSSINSNLSGLNILSELDDTINNIRQLGEIVLCGDFNARISNEPDYIINDIDSTDSFVPLPEDYIPDNVTKRNSQDTTTNSYKRHFLELLLNNSLHILNGRTLGDFKGQFTSIQRTGSSVIDYICTSPDIKHLINFMKILPFTQYSDHKPLSLNLKVNCTPRNCPKLCDAYDKAPVRYKFNDDSKEAYKNVQSDSNIFDSVSAILDKAYDSNVDGIHDLNNVFTSYLCKLADATATKTKNTNNSAVNNQPWFNKECRQGKKLINKAARIVSRFPGSDYLRQNYYKVKSKYKSLLNTNKSKYFDDLNSDIENGKVLNWKQFKRLKSHKSKKLQFDSYDMENFENFFKVLYSNHHSTITASQKEELLLKADLNNSNASHFANITNPSPNLLNSDISVTEIVATIKKLKNGKSSSSDLVCNEMLKNLCSQGLSVLEKLFNMCLDSGTYPWNNSLISPLHKKGDKENPDNYRAIAVSSNIGKLFSTILLNRLIDYRNDTCPDPPNQLGFTKGAQTYDHILTLNTITSKYRKLKKKVYTVFVDFKKAFDSVCREALFYKLSELGITGKFYNVLRYMYSNSTAQIKLSNHLSKTIPIQKGTEQGHPLSPDLFKIFLSDLSCLLEQANCPNLMGKIISHLLWADDLIILALDKNTLQLQLDNLNSFCTKWGIQINVSKTKIMVFNKTNTHVTSENLSIGNHVLQEVDSYTYLGINIHNSGSLSFARNDLRKKAMRGLYCLKNTVNKTKLSHRSLCTLFDSLIKPIVLYGAPIWCPFMPLTKTIGKLFSSQININDSLLRKISLSNCEKVHLHFLKWSLGTHRLSSNVGTWGETGRYPLIYEAINLTLKYVKRLQNCDDSSLVSLAFQEQQKNNLEWFRGIEPILKIDESYTTDHATLYKQNISQNTQPTPLIDTIIFNGIIKRLPQQTIKPHISQTFTPHIILKALKLNFKSSWQHSKSKSSKLEFYHSVKSEFSKENYLTMVDDFYDRANLSKLRISAHELSIEKGRYKNITRENRICKWCKITLGLDIIENEKHVLYDCTFYSSQRQRCNSIISNIISVPITHIDFMSLLNNSTDRDQTDENSSAISRAIAKYVTLLLSRAKTISVHCSTLNTAPT